MIVISLLTVHHVCWVPVKLAPGSKYFHHFFFFPVTISSSGILRFRFTLLCRHNPANKPWSVYTFSCSRNNSAGTPHQKQHWMCHPTLKQHWCNVMWLYRKGCYKRGAHIRAIHWPVWGLGCLKIPLRLQGREAVYHHGHSGRTAWLINGWGRGWPVMTTVPWVSVCREAGIIHHPSWRQP